MVSYDTRGMCKSPGGGLGVVPVVAGPYFPRGWCDRIDCAKMEPEEGEGGEGGTCETRTTA